MTAPTYDIRVFQTGAQWRDSVRRKLDFQKLRVDFLSMTVTVPSKSEEVLTGNYGDAVLKISILPEYLYLERCLKWALGIPFFQPVSFSSTIALQHFGLTGSISTSLSPLALGTATASSQWPFCSGSISIRAAGPANPSDYFWSIASRGK